MSPELGYRADFSQLKEWLRRDRDEWVESEAEVRSDSLLLNAITERSLHDLHALRSRLGDREYFAAGVPWFVTLFGRDSVITALQTIAFNPEIAAQTLRLLAKYQSRRTDEWRGDQLQFPLTDQSVANFDVCNVYALTK